MIHPSIRPCRLDDFAAVENIYLTSKRDEFCFEKGYPEHFEVIALSGDEKRLNDFNRSDALLFDDGVPGGVIYWQARHIVGLQVIPVLRGQGVGRALMQAALSHIEGAATLDVVASNTPAIGLYRSLGFEPQGSFQGHYNSVPVQLMRMCRLPAKALTASESAEETGQSDHTGL